MKESTAEARASKIAFLRQAVMKERAFKVKHNSHDRVEPPGAKRYVLGVVKEKNRYVYDSEDPSFQESHVPGYIKEYCTLALEKYNNEKGTNYRYVRPLRAHEGGKTRDTIFIFTFRASQSESDSDSDTFITKITSGLRFSKGEWFFGKEVQQVSQVQSKVQSKVLDGEARKALIMENRARMELRARARMELRARKADPMAPTSSTASPPKPNSNLVLELPKSSSPAADEKDENFSLSSNKTLIEM